MKNIKFVLVAALTLVSLAAGARTYTVNVGQFEKLKVNGNISVVYKNLPDSTGIARYEAPEDSQDCFSFSTKGDGSLKVEPSDDKWGDLNLPVVYLYSDFLSSVESFSEKNVEVESLAPCASFSVTQVGNGSISVDNVKCNNLTAAITTGNGQIYITGICVNANFRMVGAGLISADRLKADNVKCRILGTGSIGCWPQQNLNVTGLGSTKIYYKGNPAIKKTGGGKLFELPEELDEDAYSKLGTPVTVEEGVASAVDEENESDYNDEDTDDDDDDEEDDEDYQTIVTAND